ncbi:response regulator [Paenibacillus sp. J5C_2022]|uniref:response regulator transcription factor n=1 Tax=Paenibacillus sp. J5C2022 TaxID=2977129 RepID=UPI0021D15EA8|nr:response regulator [Paenibacillus sp. J5C2022]MCU6709936.1 response regulator [Paenibacillus sp. J5C2022]
MRIIVVDDEDLIRNHIASMIEWDEIGCQIVGAASNGIEAMELIALHEPDLVISDIRMPLMNGIQLSEYVKEKHPQIRIIFLTAYSDFEYAQQAVKLGVVDFILKPVKTSEIIRAVELQIHNTMRTSHELLLSQEKAIQQMLSTAEDESEKTSTMQKLGVHQLKLQVMCAEIDNIDALHRSGEAYSLLALREVINRNLQYYPYHYWLYTAPKGIYILLFQSKEQIWNPREDSMKIARELTEYCKTAFPFRVSVGISQVLPSLLHLGQAWKEIKECLDYRMMLGKGSIIGYDALFGLNICQDKQEEDVVHLIGILCRGEKDQVPVYLRSIYRKIVSTGLMRNNIQSYFLNIIGKVEEMLLEYGIPIQEDVQLQAKKMVISFDILVDLMKFMEQWLMEITDRMQSAQSQSVKRIIKEITAYLEMNFTDEITLEKLANHFHMNHSYLSRLIKKETGHNFRDLLWTCRIEAAKKKLTETNLRANEIAFQVGFKDATHFSLLFKKNVGISPTEYRNQVKV